ncbi:DctP family TRAP transporter solute-binding subunit [Brevibacillus humidisoli]|uniref:TRAP transporter substrate-binding protein n=1 Tax=Brevibacillus humidisoli TaxID=2895522 RepID=UPI001E458E83|nr:DctP family TRAP transporter solute-binding subunit [Brevibacillus humidisoli]UFJ38923.1 DctP family TRAP transporter solute-binding subunit [Brevibacillus humidisoli]
MRNIGMWLLVLLLASMLAGCGAGTTKIEGSGQPTQPGQEGKGSGGAGAAEFTFRLGHLQNTEHPYQKGAEKFKELLAQKSNGRIEVNIFPSSQLGNGRDQIEGLQLGTIHLHIGSVAPVANFAPKLNVLSLPYLFRDREHVFQVLDGEIGKELSADLESKGMINLSFWENGWRHLTNDVRPIKTAEDASGLKIRVLESPAYVSYVKALGSTPTPIPFGELYTALEQKVVDGQENPLAQIATNKFDEVQKYLSLNAHTYDAAVFLISKMAYDQLPAELQQAVHEAALEAAAYQRQLSEESEAKYLQQLKESGMQIEENPDLESFRKAVEPVYEELQESIGKDLIKRVRETK